MTPPRWIRGLSGRRPAKTRRRPLVARPLPITVVKVTPPWVSRDDCPGGQLQRDQFGRLPIGHCGPACIARKARDERLGRG